MNRRSSRGSRPGGVLLYMAGWAALGAAVVVGVIIARGGLETGPNTLPPVQQTELTTAAARAGCQLRRVDDGRPGNPPAGGLAGGRPAAPGVYQRAPAVPALVAALRRGTVVVQYDPQLPGDDVNHLVTLQAAVPRGTILAPNATRMPHDVAITSYHRVLACPRLTATALDAFRLFRGRYLGSGPGG